MDDSVAIRVQNVSKTFKLPHEKARSVKSLFVSIFNRKRTYEKQQVLENISFEINKGEFFGIVGRNGSGKSTLLKLMAGIYTPNEGAIQVNGKLTPFIELGVGFNPELTGRENVYLNGALLGFNRKEMDEMYQDIVDFAEIERFMDQKLKNYSSGMQVRLAFSIAIKAQSDILLLDEVLAVGDEAFQRKCYDYFEDLKREQKTAILVTHDMGAVERFCDRAVLIEAGEILAEGNPKVIANAYSELLNPVSKEKEVGEEGGQTAKNRFGDGRYKIKKIGIKIEDPKRYGTDIQVDMTVSCITPANSRIIAAYAIKDSIGQKLFGNKIESRVLPRMNKGDQANLKFTFPNILFKGRYFIDLSIYMPEEDVYADCWIDCAKFSTSTPGVQGYPLVVKSKFTEGN